MSLESPSTQPALPGFCQVEAAVAMMAAAGVEARGAVFTRREVVEFILDLARYTDDQPLHRKRLLEPSMGHGDFLTPVIDRLLIAYERETAGRRRGARSGELPVRG
jgi:type I restriction-modification system DNA methylase subunit